VGFLRRNDMNVPYDVETEAIELARNLKEREDCVVTFTNNQTAQFECYVMTDHVLWETRFPAIKAFEKKHSLTVVAVYWKEETDGKICRSYWETCGRQEFEDCDICPRGNSCQADCTEVCDQDGRRITDEMREQSLRMMDSAVIALAEGREETIN
jgi:hypothetical protein